MYATARLKSVARSWGALLSAAILLGILTGGSSAIAKPLASSSAVHTVQACAVKAGKHPRVTAVGLRRQEMQAE